MCHSTRITTLVVTAALMIAGASGLSAESTGHTTSAKVTATTTPAVDPTPDKKALVGSWLETVTFPPEAGRPPLKSLGTFHDDGTMVCSDQGAITLDPPTVFTSCHGAWTHMEQRQFAYTALELISDLSGNLVGYLKVRGTYIVSQSGNEYTGTTLAQVLDPDGVVLFSATVSNAGRRIQVELP
jgi:hypothetical protein